MQPVCPEAPSCCFLSLCCSVCYLAPGHSWEARDLKGAPSAFSLPAPKVTAPGCWRALTAVLTCRMQLFASL